MKVLLRLAAIIIVCLIASPVLAGDCSDVGPQIAAVKNNPRELRGLLQKNPQCGEVWEALGDFFYEKRVWNEAYTHYAEAARLLPDKKKLSSRLRELDSKKTAMINNEEDLLAFRRQIGGVAPASPEALTPASPLPSAGPPADRGHTSSAPARQPVTVKTPVAPKEAKSGAAKVAAKSKPSSTQMTQDVRAKAEKIGIVITFAYNSADLSSESKKLLSSFADMLNTELAGKRFLIQGHTDNIGGAEHNLRLSEERARAVRTYLSSVGVSSSRLEVKGFGFEKPIYDNDTEEGRSKNRRVEFEER